MKLVVGLGNPGIEYERTRHNVGWWALAHLADVWRFPPWRALPDALASDGTVEGRRTRLLMPQTYMNRSGDALEGYVSRPFWAVANDLLVVVDDIALPVGTFRFRAKGSAGGHNGLRSVEATFGTQEYARLRIGVGRAEPVPGEVLRDFVLGEFATDEAEGVRALLPTLAAGIATWITDGIVVAMNRYPGRPPRESTPSQNDDTGAPAPASPAPDAASPPAPADGVPST